ncbi:unnamed protein product [Arctogadus glacialis]
MSRFLLHDKTKADLTNYLAAKTLEYNSTSKKLIITSSSGHTRSNKDLVFQDNNHEEADTLFIYQAVLASQRNPPDAKMVFFSPDTDVLVLVIANYDLMLKNTSISMASGVMGIEPIWRAIGSERAKALPAFHGSMALTTLEEEEVAETMLATLASFVCAAYSPKVIYIKTISEL